MGSGYAGARLDWRHGALVRAWQDAADSFRATASQIPDEDFARPSLLPGWTVGDIVAHIAALERELSGEPLPEHEPDWDMLPHADDLFSRYTEIGVDYRRGWTPTNCGRTSTKALAVRSEQLCGPQDPRRGSGRRRYRASLGRVPWMRCFDIFPA
ncbi:MAG: maleylpyruvate isomerase N-terminal domain-containing protein [Candidatus Nanopelagicales bacterium]